MPFDRLDDPTRRETLWRDMRVRVHTNISYQQHRWRILERRENVIKVISLVSASAAFYDLKNQAAASTHLTVGVALAVIVATNSWSLVFQWGAKARDAAKRVAAWSQLESEIVRVGLVGFDEQTLAAWEAKAAELEKDEPAANKYLVWLAESEARRLYPTIALSQVGRPNPHPVLAWLQHVPRPFLAIP